MDKQLQELLDTIVGNVFGYKNPYTPEQFMQKFAFDVRLPKQTNDSTTGEVTWAQSLAPSRFISFTNVMKNPDQFELERKPIDSIEDVIRTWQSVNLMATERYKDSINIFESDAVYNSENVFRSLDVHHAKNVAFCDSANHSEYVAACQRSTELEYCIRAEDSKECSKSFNVIWSGKISNSMFIQNCYDMYECLFCSNIAGKKYCIANMQFEEAEYFELKKKIIEWILTAN